MIVRQPSMLQSLRIWQQNVHKLKTAHSYVLNTANPQDWDIIALQEPWIDSFSNLRGTQHWRVMYPMNFYMEGHPCICSILLINTNLSTDCYSVLPIMHSDVTAVHFKGTNGFLSVFNIYNEITNNEMITCLDSFLTRNAHLIRPSPLDCVLWLGDFNRHHPMWEDETNERLFKAEEYISPLIELLYRNEMFLALPKGIPTFQSAAGSWTCPDNVWCSNTPKDPILRCDVVPAIHPPLADHMPIITINMPFPRAASTHALDFWQANWIKINEDLEQRLESGPQPAKIKTKDEFNAKVDKLVQVLKDVLEDHLKERRPSPFVRRWWTKELSQLKKQQNCISNKAFKL